MKSLCLSVAVAIPLLAYPQQYEVRWFTIDGGGGTITNSQFTLSATIGQADASPQPMSGGGFALVGGFWSAASSLVDFSSNNVAIVAPAGLIAWWKLDGNGLDSAGTNDAGALNGVTSTSGVVGQALLFNGTDSAVLFSNAPTPQNLSVEAWVRFDSLDSTTVNAGYQNLVFRKNSREFNFEGFSLHKYRDINGDRIGWELTSVNGDNNRVGSTNLVSIGQYYHVVGTFDGTYMNLFVNGMLHASTYHPYPIDYGDRPMFFGTSGESWSGQFAGVLDEVSLYDRVLTAQEVATLYASGSAGKRLPDIDSLTNGGTMSGLAAAQNDAKYFEVSVTPGIESLSISTWGGTGDGDLYVRFGALPTLNTYDFRPNQTGNNETVFVTNPNAGMWYVLLHGNNSYLGVSLVASYGSLSETTPTLTTMTSNQDLLIAWPSSAASYGLESTTNLASFGSWQPWLGSLANDGNQVSATVSIFSLLPQQFFRLRLP